MMRQEEQLLEAFWSNEEQERKLLPRRDVSTSRRHQVTTWRSTITEVNHSPRRDVITSQRQLKILDLIIKCEGARESRVLKNVRPETRIGRPATLTGRFFLDFCIGFSLFAWLLLDHMRIFCTLHVLFLSFMMF